jgi:hypothetical protein
MFDDRVSSTAILLSWTVKGVHCAQCRRSDLSVDLLDNFQLLVEHGSHLQHVTLDLIITETGTRVCTPMTLRLLPLYRRFLHMN